ncbi:dolichyl-P-Glc:Man(9)GlcNAc(2)-PP-dolichol alpha-1,3-glucosyltransferase [Sugiyamaella lignohabitans]|uniref:Alpha-1,3-glucosyltransferase n=1 Tax=Sugiyamaella lignohabitans TaxID=796027 RepID=A0A167F5U5_9ASCO|nr:dolichyl-P-Glc:Man(9)GlcNAc(2)-PP-dolichol alpha-1,3-glucosyltransferase [Sugiyamaella lignohabitans]ANB14871.1 dolichyl-P-Glc:Man(9)GlcNAc(2)-PP-dolichol alpha-1,3-glucosyltransferase [Sugiyamaella lignohabitans]
MSSQGLAYAKNASDAAKRAAAGLSGSPRGGGNGSPSLNRSGSQTTPASSPGPSLGHGSSITANRAAGSPASQRQSSPLKSSLKNGSRGGTNSNSNNGIISNNGNGNGSGNGNGNGSNSSGNGSSKSHGTGTKGSGAAANRPGSWSGSTAGSSQSQLRKRKANAGGGGGSSGPGSGVKTTGSASNSSPYSSRPGSSVNSPARSRRASYTGASGLPPSPLVNSPLFEFLSPFKGASTQWVARYIIISFAIIIRSAVALGPYSGFQSPPMHGDFEAQRHWMELTIHLPIDQWYFYDLQWWGLDYPPLTAYHSWLLGKIGSAFNPSWFALGSSRGLDDYDLKSYMRATVIFSELAVYIPAVIWFVRWSGTKSPNKLSPIDQSIAAAAIIFQPAVILIDHGHFQYNTVMLGLALLSVVNLVNGHRLSSALFFVLALGFKQMALYYAPIIFAYMLGDCIFPRPNIIRLLGIGVVVILTFSALFGPLLLSGGVPVILQSIHRIFPFSRGLWEDKVANLWCTANTFVKLKTLFDDKQLQLASLVATLVSITPAMIIVFFKPRPELLPWALSAGAWGFFLFSFQVHEKSVLLPLMPATVLLSYPDPNIVSNVVWINNIATFSLWPLLHREGLVLQYVVIVFLWNWLIGNLNPSRFWKILPNSWFMRLVHTGSYTAAIALHLAEYLYPTALGFTARYPDLYILGNVTLSFACFSLFWLWTLYKLATI